MAGFYKDLRSYIYTQTNSSCNFSRFTQGCVPPNACTVGNLTNQPCPAAQPIGNYTAPFNGQGGKLSGVELSVSMPFAQLTPVLRGFGVVASMSFNRSSIEIRDPDSASSVGSGPIDLPGLSKRVSNLTFYDENGGFEARVSQRKRSDFIGEIGDFAANRKLRYVVGESIVDTQVGYNFGDGSLKGLSLLLQVNNIGDAAYETTQAPVTASSSTRSGAARSCSARTTSSERRRSGPVLPAPAVLKALPGLMQRRLHGP